MVRGSANIKESGERRFEGDEDGTRKRVDRNGVKSLLTLLPGGSEEPAASMHFDPRHGIIVAIERVTNGGRRLSMASRC